MFVQLTKEWKGKPAGETIDVPDEYAPLLIDQHVAQAVPNDPTQALVTQAMQKATDKWAQSMDQVINLALKKFAEAQAQAGRHSVPAIFGEGGAGDPKKNFGDFCVAVARNDRKYLETHYQSQFVSYSGKAALGESSGVTGGYIVPPEFYNQLLSVVVENTFIRPRAFVQPMASATLQFPYLDITTAQASGVSAFFGGVQMYWTEEAQSRTETEPQFKMMELKAHELSGYSVSSNVLLQDAAFGLEKFLMMLFGKAIAWFEEYAFIQGNGVGKPLGMQTCNAAISVTRGNANQIGFADVATMQSRLLPSSYSKAIWVAHPYTIPQLLQLKDGANRAVFISIDQGAVKRPVWQLLGQDVFFTEKVPSLGTKGDLSLFDPSLYVIGDRMQVEIAASEHVNFLKNQMTWRVVERVDGQPWLDKALTLADGSNTVSPFVVLN